MDKRDKMNALLSGERLDSILQWTMGFENVQLVRKLIPGECCYEGYGEYPDEVAYPFSSMGELRLSKEKKFNEYIDRCAFPVGWGANAAFGHCGPGEFNKTVIEKKDEYFIVRYETGAKKEIRLKPHNVHTFELPVKTEEDLEKLELPDPTNPERYAGFKEDTVWAKNHGEWTIGWVNGFFSGVHYFLRDYAEFFVDLMLESDFAKAMIKKAGDWTLAAAQKMCEAGVDCIGFCDDLGSGQSLLMSTALYREFFWPWHKRICDLVHSYGAVVHMHSHGAIIPVLPDIAAAGVDILNPLDPDDRMPMNDVREIVGPKMVLCGGMNKHFFDWTEDEQAENLRQVVKDGRKYGPFILMDSGGVMESVSRERFDRFLSMSREIRKSQP